MDTVNWLFTFIAEQIALAFGAVVLRGLLFALAGLALGIFLVIVGGRRRAFRREFGWWTHLARLHYLFIPILLMCFAGIMGGISGAQRMTGRYIDQAAQPLIDYGAGYIAQFVQQVPELPWDPAQDVKLDAFVARQVAAQSGASPGSFQHALATTINMAIITTVLDELNVPEPLRDPIGVVRALSSAKVGQQQLSALPAAVHLHCNAYFYTQYLFVWGLFAPLFFLLVAEFGLHFLARWQRRRAQTPAADTTPDEWV